MKTKIIAILAITLLISAALPTIAANENDYNYIVGKSNNVEPIDVPDSWLEGADQYQTDDCNYGMIMNPSFTVAQEFKPTKEDLTAVLLYFFNNDAPSNVDITVSIRDSLDGADLTTMTISADNKNIKPTGTWVMFDFDDIIVIPEETYYIVCYASDGGIDDNYYCWYFDVDNKYDRGIGWATDSGGNWYDLEDAFGDPEFLELDLWFITYFQEPPKSKATSTPFLNFLESHPILYQLLQRILRL